MNAVETESARTGVVLLWRDPEALDKALEGVDRDRVEVAVVRSAGQAAARLCLVDAALLVVDLRQVGLRTAPLFARARRQGVRVVAVGPLPFGLDSQLLSGTELMGLEDLAAALRDLSGCEQPAPTASTDETSEISDRPSGPDPAASPEDRTGTADLPSRQNDGEAVVDQAGPTGLQQAPAGDDSIESDADLPVGLCQADGGSERAEQVRPGALLSPEEIAALLGHDR